MSNFISCAVGEIFEGDITNVLDSIIGCMYCGIVIANKKENFVIWNTRAKEILGKDAADIPVEDWAKHYGIFHEDKETLFKTQELPLYKALNNEPTKDITMFIKNENTKEDVWISASGTPIIKDGEITGGVVVFKETTNIVKLDQEHKNLLENLAGLKNLFGNINEKLDDACKMC